MESGPGTRPDEERSLRSLAERYGFVAIVVAYCLYAALYIYRTSFVLGGERYFILLDDAMISMRYAKNLAAGYGLVWNPGEPPVEGFTNPLWVAWMALAHLLPIAASKISLVVQISGAVFSIATLVLTRRLAEIHEAPSRLAPLFAVGLVAFYMPLVKWSLLGMEVSVLTTIVTFSALAVLRRDATGRSPVPVLGLLALSTFVRLDMAALYLAVLIFVVAVDPLRRLRHAAVGSALLAAAIGTQTAMRLAYYGEWLPNTYYLKVTGYPVIARVINGIVRLLELGHEMGFVLFLLPFAVLLWRRDKPIVLLCWMVLTQMVYSAYVGGDAWEVWGGANRYISVVIPLFFVLLAHGVLHLCGVLLTALQARGVAADRSRAPVMAGAVAVCMLSVNALDGPVSWHYWALLHLPHHVEGNRINTEAALVIRDISAPDARIAVVGAGTTPYVSERPAIDMLGKMDPRIARLPARVPPGAHRFVDFAPGHMKWDYGYSIGELAPDIVFRLWGDRHEAEPYLAADYVAVTLRGVDLYLRTDSPRILWPIVGELESGSP